MFCDLSKSCFKNSNTADRLEGGTICWECRRPWLWPVTGLALHRGSGIGAQISGVRQGIPSLLNAIGMSQLSGETRREARSNSEPASTSCMPPLKDKWTWIDAAGSAANASSRTADQICDGQESLDEE